MKMRLEVIIFCGVIALVGAVAWAGGTGFSDAVSWWRMDTLNDSNSDNSAFNAYGATVNNAETIPGNYSNNLYGSCPIDPCGLGGSFYVAQYAGVNNEYNVLVDSLTAFIRFRFTAQGWNNIGGTNWGWASIFKKREAPSEKLFSLQMLCQEIGTPLWMFSHSFDGTQDRSVTFYYTPEVGTWYDLTGVFVEGEGGKLEIYLRDTESGELLANTQLAQNSTNVGNIGYWARMRIAHGLPEIDVESAAVWDVALNDLEVTKLTIPSLDFCGDPGTVYLPSDLNQDCVVNVGDFAVFAGEWLNCTDPNDGSCNQYWLD